MDFLEAAATKLLQAVFFSLLQTGYPTLLRLIFVALLLLLRVASAALSPSCEDARCSVRSSSPGATYSKLLLMD